jgi:hypothetical protein
VAGAWVKLIWNSLGVAAVAAAAQLAIAQALGIIRWDANYGDSTGWSALLTWISFIYTVAVLGGAAVGRRAVRRPTKPDGVAARITAALAAGVGASLAVSLAWLPAVKAKPPVSVHPELLVAMTAGTAIAASVVLTLVALSVPPIAGGIRAAVAWVWLVAIGSAVAGYVTHRPYPPPRLAVIDAPSIIPATVWSGPYAMVGAAAVLGIGVAAVARWGGAKRFGTAISGFAGPAVVALAYLIAGTGDSAVQLDPYRASAIAVGAGLIASVLVTVPAPRRQPGAGSTETGSAGGQRQSGYDAAARGSDTYEGGGPKSGPREAGVRETREAGVREAGVREAGVREAGVRGRQPLLDETYEPELYPETYQEPIPAQPHQANASRQDPYLPRPSVAAEPAPRPPAIMGQPPARSYTEDYSNWLRDLGHVPGQLPGQVPGQRTDASREVNREDQHR